MQQRKLYKLFICLILIICVIASIVLVKNSYFNKNYLNFTDFHDRSMFKIKLKLKGQRPIGDAIYFKCDNDLVDLGQLIVEQMPQSRIENNGNNLIIKRDNGYFYITDNGEKNYTLSIFEAFYCGDMADGMVSFLLPYYMTDITEVLYSFKSSGRLMSTSYSYDNWKEFYSYLNRPDEYTFNDVEKFIELPCLKNKKLTDSKIRLCFKSENCVCLYYIND